MIGERMTNETAIHNLFALKLRTKVLSDRDALGMGIKALEQQSNRCDSCIHSEEQNGSNCYECVKGMADNFEAQSTDVDCISREEVIKHLENITMDTNPDNYDNKDKWYQANGFNLCKVGIEMYVKNLPPVTPKTKTGHWIKLEPYPLQMHEYECSECGHETDDNTENYCSECGAKMTESEDKE